MIKLDNELLGFLKESSRYKEYSNIICWKEEHNNLPIYIFSLELCTEDELLNVWEKVNNDIAINFQSRIENEISRWNIYIYFFIKETVNTITKYNIEQDTYCARKIVIENFKEDNCIKEYIEKKLFSFDIPKENEKKIDGSLLEKVKKTNEKLANIIQEGDSIEDIMKKFLEVQ